MGKSRAHVWGGDVSLADSMLPSEEGRSLIPRGSRRGEDEERAMEGGGMSLLR